MELSSSESSDSNDLPWIQFFCKIRGHEFFCEVNKAFVEDEFNLYGLASRVANFYSAQSLILDEELTEDLSDEQYFAVERSAQVLYGLLHARYIVTDEGLKAMAKKYIAAEFGRCPRVLCNGCPVLPIGLSDTMYKHNVKLYCPSCNDIYTPVSSKHSSIDGAFFGTTFPHLLLMKFPQFIPKTPKAQFVPKIFGFKINQDSILNTGERICKKVTKDETTQQRTATSPEVIIL